MTAHRDKRMLLAQVGPAREAGLTFEQIGRQLGMSGERARQLWQLYVVDQTPDICPESSREHAPSVNIPAVSEAKPDDSLESGTHK